MTERKYISDKRILAYNPFSYLDESLFDFMDGYTFLDFLKINKGYCESFTIDINRPTKELYGFGSYGPCAIIDCGYEYMNMNLKMSIRRATNQSYI